MRFAQLNISLWLQENAAVDFSIVLLKIILVIHRFYIKSMATAAFTFLWKFIAIPWLNY